MQKHTHLLERLVKKQDFHLINIGLLEMIINVNKDLKERITEKG